jgi:hypothetical protein
MWFNYSKTNDRAKALDNTHIARFVSSLLSFRSQDVTTPCHEPVAQASYALMQVSLY